MDYILFIQVPGVTLAPNPEEVDAVKYVTQAELEEMMRPQSGLRWSPWFKILAEKFLLPKWWADLPGALNTDKFADRASIHRLQ